MWQETSNDETGHTASMTDIVFRIRCERLSVDHAAALANAVCEHAPQLKESNRAGVQSIHVAGSQNGWERPERLDEHLLLSRRTRLRIRAEVESAESVIDTLTGCQLNILGSTMDIVSGDIRAFAPSATLLARYAFFDNIQADCDEPEFIDQIVKACQAVNYSPTKILCGKAHNIMSDDGERLTRSVLLADVPAAASIALQDNGIGDGRLFGCGILIPHKDTHAVHDQTE